MPKFRGPRAGKNRKNKLKYLKKKYGLDTLDKYTLTRYIAKAVELGIFSSQETSIIHNTRTFELLLSNSRYGGTQYVTDHSTYGETCSVLMCFERADNDRTSSSGTEISTLTSSATQNSAPSTSNVHASTRRNTSTASSLVNVESRSITTNASSTSYASGSTNQSNKRKTSDHCAQENKEDSTSKKKIIRIMKL